MDRQIFMGDKNAVHKPEDKDFSDKRNAAARDMARAESETKHTMFRRMLAAALKAGHRAKYVLGDAWFGCKENIATALECGLEAIFQMKRGLMKYRIDDPSAPGATAEGITYTAHQLYEKHKMLDAGILLRQNLLFHSLLSQ
ncbi:MAG: transposase [Verrucomicrobiales bacterium]